MNRPAAPRASKQPTLEQAARAPYPAAFAQTESRSVSASNIVYIYPGQGSQYRGMGSDLVAEFPAARDIFERASEVVDYDMAALCFDDPRGALDRTRYTQPALLTHELACSEALQSLAGPRVSPALAAGHSLGEFSALVSAGALTFEDALRLVSERGRLMGELGTGSMLALALAREAATALADSHCCAVAACNLPDQTVVAGQRRDLDAVVEDLNATHPGKRWIPLNTQGAFHSYYMAPAAREFREILDATPFAGLKLDVPSNYTGALHIDDPAAIRSRLFFQLFNPVLWVDCMRAAIETGAGTIIELGGGSGKGEDPANKRPTLRSVVLKTLKSRGHKAKYLPAVNAAGIRAAAEYIEQRSTP